MLTARKENAKNKTCYWICGMSGAKENLNAKILKARRNSEVIEMAMFAISDKYFFADATMARKRNEKIILQQR
jgi:hypothetical protein